MAVLQASPLLRGFEQGAGGTDAWNDLAPGGARGPLTLDPQGVALGQQFQAIKAGIEAGQTTPIWNPNNPVGTDTIQSVGMPQPTTYAGSVGQFVNPQTGQLTTQGQARLDNPMLGVDTGGVVGMAKVLPRAASDVIAHGTLFHGTREPITVFQPRPTYLTPDETQAGQYARGVHLGGKGTGEPITLPVATKPGRTVDVNDELFKAMDDGWDVGDALEDAIANARHNGYRYVTYDHPSAGGGDDHRVVVSLHPHEDLDLSVKGRQKR